MRCSAGPVGPSRKGLGDEVLEVLTGLRELSAACERSPGEGGAGDLDCGAAGAGTAVRHSCLLAEVLKTYSAETFIS